VVAYAAPKITSLTVTRCLADGTENYEGTYAKIAFNYSISAVNSKNTNTYVIEYKPQSGTTWTALTNGTGYAVNTSIISADGPFDVDTSYDLRLSITDSFTTIRSQTEIPTAFTLLDFNASGRGVAFGKVSEKTEGVEFALPLYSSHPGKVLWSGTWYMTAAHIANLSEKISEQVNGIVLVFSRIGDGVAQNDNFASFFVPKYVVAQHPGLGMNFFMAHSSFEYVGAKYLYITDTQVKGHANNSLIGTGVSGIKFENNRFILRYVLGV
jgi:hypothetical protein